MGFREWLQLFRAQTAAATITLVLVFYLVGGGELFSWFAIALIIWAWLDHLLTFGENSLMDSCRVPEIGALPYDALDKEGKGHHPLITGKISLRSAHKIIHFGLILLVTSAIPLTYWGGGDLGLAMACFSLYLVCGFCYNCGLDKETVFAFVPISLCFSFLGLWAFFITSKEIHSLAIWMVVYMFLLEWYENGVEGCIKELQTGEVNMIRFLGGSVINGYFRLSKRAKAYAWGIKLASIGVAAYILCMFCYEGVMLFLFVVLGGLMLFFCDEITKDKVWDRNKALRDFACEEIASIYLLPCILMPIIGYIESVVLMVFGIVYFVTINRVNWGTVLRPQV